MWWFRNGDSLDQAAHPAMGVTDMKSSLQPMKVNEIVQHASQAYIIHISYIYIYVCVYTYTYIYIYTYRYMCETPKNKGITLTLCQKS